MLKVLLKKQLAEVFKSYFYDAKKNRMRSKGAIAGWIVFFVFIMVGVLGGMFTVYSLTLCGPLTELGMGWLYFLLMSTVSILLGAFGSVFNTYSGLYLAKDNDLLLSMPIPVRTIMAARLMNVYLMGAMYSSTALIPMLIVYWVVAGATAANVICGILLYLIETVAVLLLSCLLGWVVAKISLRVRHKSFVAVFASLLFVAAYYFFYFKASDLIRDLLLNAALYGEKIKGSAYGLYLFGRVGEGDWGAAALCLAVTAILALLIWRVMSRSFVRIATSSGRTEKVRYVEKTARERSAFAAFLSKEFARFGASPNYMLNCGFGVLMLPLAGLALLIKGKEIIELLLKVFGIRQETAGVLICCVLCMLSSMNDMATPSVSLEGKSLWIPQSLPIPAKTVLRAKAALQLILTLIPMLFASVCAALVTPGTVLLKLLLVVQPLVYVVFSTLLGLLLGLRMPLLSWTNEIVPIKQSGACAIVILGSWVLSIVPFGIYMVVGYRLGAPAFLAVWIVLLAITALLLWRWLDTAGAKLFEAL